MYRIRNDKYIRIEVDAGFLLFAAGAVLLAGLDTMLALFSAVLLHESAHALVTKLCGGSVESLRLELSGLNMKTVFDRTVSYRTEIICAAAGPLINLALGVALAFLARGYGLLYSVAGANIILGVFNLIPAGRFDGGSILKSVSERLFSPMTAYYFTKTVSIVCGVLVAAGGVVLFWKSGRNITLLFCGLFLSWSLVYDRIDKKNMPKDRKFPFGLIGGLMKFTRMG